VTALELDYSVATGNLRHFQRIPGLSVVQLSYLSQESPKLLLGSPARWLQSAVMPAAAQEETLALFCAAGFPRDRTPAGSRCLPGWV
jgi:hypothetical protein